MHLGERWHEDDRIISAEFCVRIDLPRVRFLCDATAALAEFAVQFVGPKLPENGDNELVYQRPRSTSSDVDEGTADRR